MSETVIELWLAVSQLLIKLDRPEDALATTTACEISISWTPSYQWNVAEKQVQDIHLAVSAACKAAFCVGRIKESCFTKAITLGVAAECFPQPICPSIGTQGQTFYSVLWSSTCPIFNSTKSVYHAFLFSKHRLKLISISTARLTYRYIRIVGVVVRFRHSEYTNYLSITSS